MRDDEILNGIKDLKNELETAFVSTSVELHSRELLILHKMSFTDAAA